MSCVIVLFESYLHSMNRCNDAGCAKMKCQDYDTTGLILFSRDGTLTQRLLHPRRGVEKEYVATVRGPVNRVELERTLSAGVETAE